MNRKPAQSTIDRQLKKLRSIVENDPDKVKSRVAQALEYGILWATTKHTGWTLPEVDVEWISEWIKEESKKSK